MRRDSTIELHRTSQLEPTRPIALAGAPLTDRQVDRFTVNGFLAVQRLCAPREMQIIATTLRDLFSQSVGRDEGSQFDMLGADLEAQRQIQPQLLKPSQFFPALLRTDYFRTVAAIAKQLLGPDAHFSFDHSILKPAGSAASTPWHQDEVHQTHKYYRYRQISFWMPLQNTPLKKGCMRYVRGSHLGELLPHRAYRNDPRIHAIECIEEYVDERLAVSVPVTAGSCILHDGRTLHGALPNVSREDRLAYILAFIGPPIPRAHRTYVPLEAQRTAHERRHMQWLLRGGFVVTLVRRWESGLRASPKLLWMKLRIFAKTLLRSSRR